MIFLLAFSVFQIVPFLDAAEEFNPLGRGVYLPQFNLLGEFKDSGSQILSSSAVKQCTKEAKQDVSRRGFQFYKDTEEFYSSLTSTSNLESSLQTDFSLGLTLDTASKNVAGTNRTVTGNSLLFVASYRQELINKSCLNYANNFDQKFLDSFQKLPVTIDKPWYSDRWKPYDVFLRNYGSHVITSISMGSAINQMAFAETSNSYTETDFQVKSCISLGIPLEANFSMCSGIDKSEASRVSKMSMTDELVIKGGTTQTRNELIKNRTPDLIEKFMNEANATNTAIQYMFKSIWDILEALHVGYDTENFVRAVNLEYYYLGFLNYGCYHQSAGGQDLQMFNFTEGSSPTSPQYECSLAPEGCHNSGSHGDCHYRMFHYCNCKGPSCVRYGKLALDTGKEKATAFINNEKDWGGPGCHQKNLRCHCSKELKQRKTVWRRESKDVTYKAHYLNLNREICDMCKRKEA